MPAKQGKIEINLKTTAFRWKNKLQKGYYFFIDNRRSVRGVSNRSEDLRTHQEIDE